MNARLAVAAIILAGVAGCVDQEKPTVPEPEETRLNLTFRVPAQLKGSMSLTGGQWALLLFAPTSKAEFLVDAPGGGQATNYTDLKYRINEEQVGFATDSAQVGSEQRELGNPFQASAKFGADAWGSLYVRAESIALYAQDVDGSLGSASVGTSTAQKLPNEVPSDTYRLPTPRVPADSVTLGVGSDSGVAFTLQATGVQKIFWYNATVSCSTAGHCPDAPAFSTTRVPGRSSNGIEFRTYTELSLDGASLDGQGSMLSGVVGGEIVDLDLAGAARLPLATGRCASRACVAPANQTFTVSGELALNDLAPVPGRTDRVQGRMVADLDSAALDESFLEALSARQAMAGTAVLVVVLVTMKPLLALFTRHNRPALDNPRVRRLFDLIVSQPGLSFSELRRATGSGTGNLRRRLEKLLRARLVVMREYGNSRRYFENHGRYDQGWQGHAALQDSTARQVHDWLAARPGSTQTQLLAGLGPATSRSTLQYSLKRLKAAGLVEEEREGRHALYWAKPPRTGSAS